MGNSLFGALLMFNLFFPSSDFVSFCSFALKTDVYMINSTTVPAPWFAWSAQVPPPMLAVATNRFSLEELISKMSSCLVLQLNLNSFSSDWHRAASSVVWLCAGSTTCQTSIWKCHHREVGKPCLSHTHTHTLHLCQTQQWEPPMRQLWPCKQKLRTVAKTSPSFPIARSTVPAEPGAHQKVFTVESTMEPWAAMRDPLYIRIASTEKTILTDGEDGGRQFTQQHHKGIMLISELLKNNLLSRKCTSGCSKTALGIVSSFMAASGCLCGASVFSREISIITKPPTEKRLSKNARHLLPQSPPG